MGKKFAKGGPLFKWQTCFIKLRAALPDTPCRRSIIKILTYSRAMLETSKSFIENALKREISSSNSLVYLSPIHQSRSQQLLLSIFSRKLFRDYKKSLISKIPKCSLTSPIVLELQVCPNTFIHNMCGADIKCIQYIVY